MTDTERADALQRLYEAIDELMTPEETTTYPVLDHLGDLIADLDPD